MSSDVDQQTETTSEPEAPHQELPEQKKESSRIRPILFTAIVLAILAGIAYTAVYEVPSGAQGVVFRFGKYAGTVDAGFHLKLPLWIDRVYFVDKGKVSTETFGYRSEKTVSANSQTRDPESLRQSMMLTGDLCLIGVAWSVQYRTKDAILAMTGVHDPVQCVRDAGESVMRMVVGDMDLDSVVLDREHLKKTYVRELQKRLDAYGSGISIVDAGIRDVFPPDDLKDAFNTVMQARQEKDRIIQEAMETYNREVPKAKGEAQGLVASAQGYALERVSRAKGEALKFDEVLGEYRNARAVTKSRLYLETMKEVMPRAGQIYVIDARQKGSLSIQGAAQSLTGGSK